MPSAATGRRRPHEHMRQLERNESPFITTARLVVPLLTLGVGVATLAGVERLEVARLAIALFAGGLILAAWAYQSGMRWTTVGFLWRYAACCAVTLSMRLVCYG